MSAHTNSSLVSRLADDIADKGYSVLDAFLSRDEVGRILQTDEFKNSKLQFKKAAIGKNTAKKVIEEIRGDYIRWIDPKASSSPITAYLDRLKEIIPLINENLFLSLKDVEVHLTFYPPGTFYKRHRDQFKSDDHRKLSVICYLNEGWTEDNGGQLRMHLPNGPINVLPLAGRLVCFRSDLVEHEVLPANKERLSLTGWMIDRAQYP